MSVTWPRRQQVADGTAMIYDPPLLFLGGGVSGIYLDWLGLGLPPFALRRLLLRKEVKRGGGVDPATVI